MTKLEAEFNDSNSAFLDSLPDEFPKADFSEEHKRFIEETDKNFKAGKYNRRFSAKKLTVVLIAAALICALAIPTFSDIHSTGYSLEEVSGGFYRYSPDYVRRKGDLSSITVNNLPEGYVLKEEEHLFFSVSYFYVSSFEPMKEIAVFKGINPNIDIDNEQGEVIAYKHNDIDYIVYGANTARSVIWNYNGYIYKVNAWSPDGSFADEEILELAYSIE